MTEFTEKEIERYSRHLLLPEVGGKGQKKIAQARVFLVGAGGLGSPVSLYLAAAGIGTLGIIDPDVVDLSNLHRQIIHHTPDIGRPKVDSSREKIEALNDSVKVISFRDRLTSKNALDLLRDFDVIVDGSDNFPTKFLVNDAAFFLRKPLIHGGILRFVGQVFTIIPTKSACYRCVFKNPPPPGVVPSCQEAGVLGAVAGVIGTIQATEVLKVILGIGHLLIDRLLTYDAFTGRMREVRIRKNPHCPLCGEEPAITNLVDYEQEACRL